MSSHELNRVEVTGRVKNRDVKLSDAAVMLDVSYRQANLRDRLCARETAAKSTRAA